MKRLLLKWAAKQFAKMLNSNTDNMTFHDLSKYGIADILTNRFTHEPMVVFDGVKPRKEGNSDE